MGKAATPVLAALSWGITRVRGLRHFFDEPLVFKPSSARPIRAVLGWGRKPTSIKARIYALRHRHAFWSVEEGFICSKGLPSRKKQPLSLLVDKTGVHYDATQPSDLETLFNQGPVSPEELAAAPGIIQRVLAQSLGKYGRGPLNELAPTEKRRVLLVDQLKGDASLEFGNASDADFKAMASYALARFPDAEILVKPHPAATPSRPGVLAREWLPGATWLPANIDAHRLLAQVDEVLVVTSQMGAEALLNRKPVTCFGHPFYAGWGLTTDVKPFPSETRARRQRKLSIEAFFVLAYQRYPRYVHPRTKQRCSLDELLTFQAKQQRYQFPEGPAFYIGLQFWKRHTMRGLAGDFEKKGLFCRTVEEAVRKGLGAGAVAFVWGHRLSAAQEVLLQKSRATVVRVEDGFLRSVGLGSELVPPVSLVFDSAGIYYDARSRSGLEQMLEEQVSSTAEAQEARELMNRITAHRLTKYNLDTPGATTQAKVAALRAKAAGRRLILLPGQVRGDASLRYGLAVSQEFRVVAERIRALNPDAFIIFRPHPEVLCGNREGDIHEVGAAVDLIECELDTQTCMDAADEVHVVTSLTGFEALLRNKEVHTWGMPFYAGWGLTTDHALPRPRLRVGPALTLEDLIYTTLVRYPRYFDWEAGCFVNATQVMDILVQQRSRPPRFQLLPALSRYGYKLRALFQAVCP